MVALDLLWFLVKSKLKFSLGNHQINKFCNFIFFGFIFCIDLFLACKFGLDATFMWGMCFAIQEFECYVIFCINKFIALLEIGERVLCFSILCIVDIQIKTTTCSCSVLYAFHLYCEFMVLRFALHTILLILYMLLLSLYYRWIQYKYTGFPLLDCRWIKSGQALTRLLRIWFASIVPKSKINTDIFN